MFSKGHLIWILISAIIIVVGYLACRHYKPSLKKLFTIGLIAGIISEIIKYFSVIKIVPMVEPTIVNNSIEWVKTGEYTPYLQAEHLPFELCSLYLLFMLLAIILKNEKYKNYLYSLMYVSGIFGGVLGIVLSSIAGDFHSTIEYFTSFRVYQFFLYHSMVVFLSLYLGRSEESGLEFKDWKKAILGLLCLDIPTFYFNSVLSSEVYVNNEVIGVTHRINFFSSYVEPIVLITEKWQWIVYLLIRAILTILIVIGLFALLKKNKKNYS